ncbi:MAG: histidinol-phosphate transaminase [Chloroflexi bacterium]|nr:histidinol-phosphate transaminase [Chloroflexota bacterium]
MKTGDVRKLIRPHLVSIKTYDPVDPPELLAQQAGIPPEKVIKLNGNENPYGSSPKAAEAVAKAPLHIYPDPQQRRMRRALSEYTGVEPDCIIAGAGSDELIDLLFRLFISEGDRILDCDPTFAMYAFCARVAGGSIQMIPRDELFEIDVDAIREAIDGRTKIIFISSPNNPTGNLASESQVRELLDTGLIVVVDEAYYEFCGQTMAPLVQEHENLVVLRTMSKWAGLAGLRIGYGIMSPSLVGHLMDIKSPYNVNVAAEAALLASLDDAPALMENVRKIVSERERMFALLRDIPGVTVWPSSGNYILCQLAPGRAQDVFKGLASRGIFVRSFGSERLRDCFRVAVGTPEQTDAFISALREIV